MLRYDSSDLAAIPYERTASFTGIGNLHRIVPIESEENHRRKI
jgi:hypothetical protein